ncbi:LysR family transcriptional regulator [Saccharopolyspora oryzae]|uniref:LysR family transcriptional regulator n=1 Tax=Saccharopolyspora oryzae TaxID=2997343 RepID=A0ABT4UXA9_9PSEU|nr:LysR family transcriptional regulator [Saccharopolyspora oryzae]MDA3626163.1 LysR family transcriptional regulator [Saccharopolyspora oryzae]
MRFEQLRYLEAALRTGSFRQAAHELGVSQPTITNQVQRLEEDLGVVLVLRGTHGVRPTDAAERILAHVKSAIRAEDLLRQEASAIDGLKIGKVTLGTVAIGSMRVLPHVVRELHEGHPNILFEVSEGGTYLVRDGVLNGNFDIGLITRIPLPGEPPDDERLHYIDLMTGRLVLCVPDSHPLARAETFDVDDLAGEPLIFFTEGSILRKAFQELITGIDARIVYTTNGAETAQRMVRAGVGIAIANTLAPSTISGNGVTLIPINKPWAQTTLSAIVRLGEMRGRVVDTLLRQIRASTPSAGWA